MKHLSLTLVLVALTASLFACGSDTEDSAPEAYDPNWDDSTPAQTGKADVIDFAEELGFEGGVKGSVTSTQIDLYKMNLTRGDKFTMTMDVTEGDLAPDFRLFFGTSVTIRSESFDVTKTQLVKDYAVEDTGTYTVLVRAFRNRGAGDYALGAKCTGGPCNGEFEEPEDFEFDFEGLDVCMTQISGCALESIEGQSPGDVDPEIASLIMFECAAKSSFDGVTCEGVCEHEDVDGLCEVWESNIQWMADGGDACLGVFNECWDECAADHNSSRFDDEFTDSHHWICTEIGFNGTCFGYAQDHEDCGGKLEANDEDALCMNFCWSTTGAWIDDLDTICDESCDCDDACFERLDDR